MHLTPHEIDKLILHQAGVLAQKRLARGLRLNYPESVALIATQMLEFIREGFTVAELMDMGKRLIGHSDVMEGVAAMIDEVQVEGTFPDGSKLVTIHQPISAEQGDLKLALHGSFLPIPERRVSNSPTPEPVAGAPGEILALAGEIELNAGRPETTIKVLNRGDRPIQVGSHYHFIEVNRDLEFDREKAYGLRLNIPAGTAVRFEPGESKTVVLVPIAGKKVISGGNSLATGPVSVRGRRQALQTVSKKKFRDVRSQP